MTIETELPAVKVRELEWREDWGGSLEDIPEWRAKTPWGSITVSVAGHRDAGGNRYERHSDVSEDLYRRLIGTAQADYERRILSALVPSTAEPVAWLCTSKNTGKRELRFEPIDDLPFNRKNWTWTPLFDAAYRKASDDLKEAEGVRR